VAAEANVTLVEIPDEYVPDSNLESLGWRVYPLDDSETT
jgi:hypothetical protein